MNDTHDETLRKNDFIFGQVSETFEEVRRKKKFTLGRMVMTRGVADLVEQGFNLIPVLIRFSTGDWGDLCNEDKRSNDLALRHDGRLFGAYEFDLNDRAEKIWIITEWDRSFTTILLPDEY